MTIAGMRCAASELSDGWPVPVIHPPLGATDVHVWLARISSEAASEAACFGLLDTSERERAGRFHFGRDRQRYVIAHGLMRLLLARYSGERPERLRFGAGPFGKPVLLGAPNAANLHYNLSHAGDLVLLAVARSGAVGVDVERWDDAVEYDGVAAYCFSDSERATLAGKPGRDKAAAFFAAWTRKEAYIKATGFGVAQGLDHFDVSLTPGTARLFADRRDRAATARWSMHDLAPGAGYSGALVAGAATLGVRRFTFIHPVSATAVRTKGHDA